jgi:hypothetical protein
VVLYKQYFKTKGHLVFHTWMRLHQGQVFPQAVITRSPHLLDQDLSQSLLLALDWERP